MQYAYIATLYGLGIFAGTLFVAMRTRWNWQLLGVNPVDWPEVAYAVMIGTAGALAIIGGTLASQQAAGVLDEQLTGLRQALTETSPVLIGGAAVLFVISVTNCGGIVLPWGDIRALAAARAVLGGIVGFLAGVCLVKLEPDDIFREPGAGRGIGAGAGANAVDLGGGGGTQRV